VHVQELELSQPHELVPSQPQLDRDAMCVCIACLACGSDGAISGGMGAVGGVVSATAG
jgi:hypothetical protein